MAAARRKCPGCGRLFRPGADDPWRPFCSERCQLIDLGGWLGGRHAIPGEPLTPSPAAPADDETP